MTQALEANLSTLILSIASSAAMYLELTPDPNGNKVQKDLNMAKFNIDLLLLLQTKTKGNLNNDEEELLRKVIQDLQLHYVNGTKI